MLEAHIELTKKSTLLLSELLSRNITDMKRIALQYCSIDYNTAIALFNIFSTMPSLTYIDLSSNNITHHAAQSINAFLENNTSIETLILNCNRLGDTGAALVIQGSSRSTSLRTLKLSDNGITRLSAPHIGKLLKKTSTMTELDLSSYSTLAGLSRYAQNDLGRDAILDITNAMPYNTSITVLNLQGSCAPFILQKLQALLIQRDEIFQSIIQKYNTNSLSIDGLKTANKYMPAILSIISIKQPEYVGFSSDIYNKLANSICFKTQNTLSILPADVIGLIFNHSSNVSITRFISIAKTNLFTIDARSSSSISSGSSNTILC